MKKQLTYKGSGVDIDKANAFVSAITKSVQSTTTPQVLKRKGAFGGLYELGGASLKRPVMVSSTDGVGTKLLLAQALGRHGTVGIDLVAMNVNDILCAGATPLFFLDYIACGRLDPKVLRQVVKGIAAGCRDAGCALIGGETAEMPGMYAPGEYDLAGFAVGVVEHDRIIDGSGITAGDVLIGLASSGLHSNGYSLARKALSSAEQKTHAAALMRPTRIYVKDILAVTAAVRVRGLAHITGGAYYEKLTKILPDGLAFRVDRGAWPVPKIFHKIQKNGKISDSEMYRTFNMGIGMVMVLSQQDAGKAQSLLAGRKVKSYVIGETVVRQKNLIEFS